jgi:hypothetical protein
MDFPDSVMVVEMGLTDGAKKESTLIPPEVKIGRWR